MKKRNLQTLSRVFKTAYFVLFFVIYITIPVYAYIDPATTAMLTQIVAGIFISVGLAFAMFRRKIILFFQNIKVKRIQQKIEKGQNKVN
jgi:hypothetical protein